MKRGFPLWGNLFFEWRRGGSEGMLRKIILAFVPEGVFLYGEEKNGDY